MDRRQLAVLIGLAALLVLLRLHTWDEPLETDITGAAVITHEVLGGRALYADMWDHKPPALVLTHAAAQLVAGYGPGSILLLREEAGKIVLDPAAVTAISLYGDEEIERLVEADRVTPRERAALRRRWGLKAGVRRRRSRG